MSKQQQQQQQQQKSTLKILNKVFKSEQLNEFHAKHLLTPFIKELSNQIQTNSKAGILLNIENDALEHIEYLILTILNHILYTNASSQMSLDLKEAEFRVRRILPKNLGDAACQKAFDVLNKYDECLNTTSLLRNLVSKMTKKQQILNANGILVYPIDLLGSVLTRDLCKTETVNIFIVSVLEFLTKDILRFCSSYARNLRKFIITKRDVRTAICADHMLTELFLSGETTTSPNDSPTLVQTQIEFTYDLDSAFLNNNSNGVYYPSSSISSNNSDTTVCEQDDQVLSLCYSIKVKELLYEQNQHLQDLNLIRKVFYNYFKEVSDGDSRLVDEIFHGINDVYECALKFYDSLDDTLNQTSDLSCSLVGCVFWDLAEGAEFDVYGDYASRIYDQIDLIGVFIDSDPNRIHSFLNNKLKNLADISKYLLPKLLLGPKYHILYIFDTIDYLSQISQVEEDRDLLQQTLDTLKPIKFALNDDQKRLRRPIETSIRIMQQHISPIEQLNTQIYHSLVRQTDFFYYNQISDKKLRELEMNTVIEDGQISLFSRTSKRNHLYLYDTVINLVKSNHPIEHLNKSKQSERVLFLFDGSIYLFKSIGGGKLKLKSEISLAKCYLVDRKMENYEDVFIELQFYDTDTAFMYLFVLKNSSHKLSLMSLLCYVQYRFQLDCFLQAIVEDHNRSHPLPIPPQGYKFDHEDSPDVILFDSDENRLSTDGPTIKAATLVKLVERITHHLYLYPKFSRTFLMCYREFCTSDELLSLLIDRFNVPELHVNGDSTNKIELIKRFKREYEQPIKLKVINVLKHWIEGYFYDFDGNSPLYARLNEFVYNNLNKRYQEVLVKILQKKVNQTEREVDHGLENLPSFEFHLEKQNPFELLTIHPLEFARQATLMESEIYKAIQPNELISLGWTKSDRKHELSPNVSKLINLSNKFTYWYAKCIVDTLNFDERVAVMQRILDIAHYFYELNNFSGLKEIYAALETVSVRRLKATREKIDLDSHVMFQRFQELFDSHQSGYLDRLRKCNPPCVPFIGIHLTSILKTREFNKLNSDEHTRAIQKAQLDAGGGCGGGDESTSSQLINMSKYRKLVELVTELLQYQNTTYKLRTYNEVRTYLLQEIDSFEGSNFDYDSCPSPLSGNSILDEEFSFSTQNQSNIIENWLYNKSKQLEDQLNVLQYPHLRKYSLKCPLPKYKPDVSSLSESIISTSYSSTSLKVQQMQKNIKASTSSISSYAQQQQQHHHHHHHVDKISIVSSADSSAPNSPPPNYDDVITIASLSTIQPSSPFVNTKNCFDNPSYFKKLNEQQTTPPSATYTHIKRHSFSLPLSSPNRQQPQQQSQNTIFFPPERPSSASSQASFTFCPPTQLPPQLTPRPASPHLYTLQPPPIPKRMNQ